jgi:LAO/AO transport system kinase
VNHAAPAKELLTQIRAGDIRALAQAISLAESNHPGSSDVVRGLSARGNSRVTGITGPPGGGKSTLISALIGKWRARGEQVGVLAVDPSSPKSQGSFLGDRIRMQDHHGDSGVFIRSMATHGHLGGLSDAVYGAVRLLAASERKQILLETVGVGQSELEVMNIADTTVVLLTPASGDDVQMMKAGIIEIADVFVINRSDEGDAESVKRHIRGTLGLAGTKGEQEWRPPVLLTIATTGKGVDEVVEALDAHYEYLVSSGELQVRRSRQVQAEVEAIVNSIGQQRVREAFEGETMKRAMAGDPDSIDPHAIAKSILDAGKTIG